MKLNLSRRSFLIAGGVIGGGLMLGIGGVAGYVASHDRLGMQRAEHQGPGHIVALWLRIDVDGGVTLLAPHTEMGQGSQTGLRQLAAEELDVAWDQIRVEQAPADYAYATGAIVEGFLFGELDGWAKTFGSGLANRIADGMNMQMTGGSTAVRYTGWMSVRTAAAAARQMLIGAAAASLGVPRAELTTTDGLVRHEASGRTLSYGELAADAAAQPVPDKPPLKDPSEWRYVGRGMGRFDLPDKVFGTAEYGIDTKVDGMRYAAVRQSGPFGAEVASVTNEAEILARRGVEAVVTVDNGVAVVADNPWRAEQAVRALTFTVTATEGDAVDQATLWQRMDEALDGSLSSLHSEGDVSPVEERADVEATYRVPFLAHAPMEPMNCTVWEQGGQLHVSAGVQNPLSTRAFLAETSGRPFEQVALHTRTMGGGFGRRAIGGDGTARYLAQGVQVHQAIDKPVQLLWSREQDTRAGAFRPADTAKLRARLGSDGKPIAWDGASYANLNEVDQAVPAYRIPGVRVRGAQADPFLPFAFWRSVDASSQCFFVESFIDECAVQAGANPLDYRLSLVDPADRRAGVLQLVREMSEFRTGVDGRGRAMGVALNHCFGSYCAIVAEVSLDGDRPRVHHLWIAADCGVVVNPDSVEAQLQGGALYGLSAALYGKVEVKDGAAVQSNFHDYPVVRFRDQPALHVQTIQSAESPGGVGELGTPPVAPAVCNALAVLGERVRVLPVVG